MNTSSDQTKHFLIEIKKHKWIQEHRTKMEKGMTNNIQTSSMISQTPIGHIANHHSYMTT